MAIIRKVGLTDAQKTLLKVTNTGAQATDFSVFITFFEEVVG